MYHYLSCVDNHDVQSKQTAATKFLLKQNPLCVRQRRRIQRKYCTALVFPIATRCHRLAAKGLSKPVPIDTRNNSKNPMEWLSFPPSASIDHRQKTEATSTLNETTFLIDLPVHSNVNSHTAMRRDGEKLENTTCAPSFPSIFLAISLSFCFCPPSAPRETARNGIVESRLLTCWNPWETGNFFRTKPGQRKITHKVWQFFFTCCSSINEFFSMDDKELPLEI